MNRRDFLVRAALFPVAGLVVDSVRIQDQPLSPSLRVIVFCNKYRFGAYVTRKPRCEGCFERAVLYWWSSDMHYEKWHEATLDNPIIQRAINELLIFVEKEFPDKLNDDSDVMMELTRQQADGIASSPEYMLLCLGAPDALCGVGPDFDRHNRVMRGLPPVLETGNTIYGFRVKIVG